MQSKIQVLLFGTRAFVRYEMKIMDQTRGRDWCGGFRPNSVSSGIRNKDRHVWEARRPRDAELPQGGCGVCAAHIRSQPNDCGPRSESTYGRLCRSDPV